jgi:hypothetical protein
MIVISVSQLKRQGRLEDIHFFRIVYWYGVKPSKAYGRITPQEFVSYDEGVRSGLVEKPHQAALRKEKEAAKQLSKSERGLIRGMAELLDDHKKRREARDRIKVEFRECYYYPSDGKDPGPDVPTTMSPARKRKKAEAKARVIVVQGKDTVALEAGVNADRAGAS